MSVSKVKFDAQYLINLENDTVTENTLLEGYTAHNANGDIITGTFNPSSSGSIDITENGTYDVRGKATANVNVGSGMLNGSTAYDFWPGYTTNHNITIPDTSIDTQYKYEYLFQYGKGGNSTVSCPNLTGASVSYALAYFLAGGANIRSFSADAITSVDSVRMFYQLTYGSSIPSISFHNLETISSTGSYSFYQLAASDSDSTSLTSIDFTNLREVHGSYAFVYAFDSQVGLYADSVGHPFPNLEYIGGSSDVLTCTKPFNYTFRDSKFIMLVFDKLLRVGGARSTTYDNDMFGMCNGVEFQYRSDDSDGHKSGISFPSLTLLGGDDSVTSYYACRTMYGICTSCTNNCALYFASLQTIKGRASQGTSYGPIASCGATYVYMPKLTNAGTTASKYVFYNATTITELHFGMENQATIEAMTGYSTLFGATNATIYFDLSNHLTINGIVYDRDGPNDDYDTWHMAWSNTDATTGTTTTYYTDNFAGTIGSVAYTKSGSSYVDSGYIVTVAT